MVGAIVALTGGAGTAQAQDDCSFEIKVEDFEQSDIDRLYNCVNDALAEGYASQGHEIGSVYREWQVTATGPYAPGPHGDRFLLTYANAAVYADYVAYTAEEGFTMLVGSALAKESYKLAKKGKPRRGPLFIMSKVAAGAADEFDNWMYSAVQPKGMVMKIKQSFCHVAFSDQDNLGYPDTDVRLEH